MVDIKVIGNRIEFLRNAGFDTNNSIINDNWRIVHGYYINFADRHAAEIAEVIAGRINGLE